MTLTSLSCRTAAGAAALVLTLVVSACGGGAAESGTAAPAQVSAAEVPSIESHATGLPSDVDADGQSAALAS